MRYRYFVVAVGYDGAGRYTFRNGVLLREKRLLSNAEIARLEEDLAHFLDAPEQEHVLLNFIELERIQ